MEILKRSKQNMIFYGKIFKEDVRDIFLSNSIINKNVVLVTGISSFDESVYKKEFLEICERFDIKICSIKKISPNPELFLIKKDENIVEKIDWIFCVGGGSVIDYGKLLKLKKFKNAKIFALYTMPGSGSIVTPFTIYNNNEFKVGEHSEDIIPNISYINEVIIDNINYERKLFAICDIYSHAMEAYLSKIASPVSKKYSLQSLNIILSKGLHVQKIKTRDLILADIYAAAAESEALVLFPHAIGHYLTYKFNIPHSISSIFYFRKYCDLLISKNIKLERKYIEYVDKLRKHLIENKFFKEVYDIDTDLAMEMIEKYMPFSMQNSPVNITNLEYINLIKK
jgi:alcohol dehydrogenase class IV